METFWEDLKSGRFASMVKESTKGRALMNSKEAFNIMKPLCARHPDVEKLYCIFMDAKNRIIEIEEMFSGSLTSAQVYPRELVKAVLKHQAAALIMIHNHPSGDPAPSAEDFAITKMVAIALHCIGATLHEHIIIGDANYYSLADNGDISGIVCKVREIF